MAEWASSGGRWTRPCTARSRSRRSSSPGDLPESERSEFHQRAVREARAAALLDHPDIITVYDVVTEDDRPWIVMELVAGRSLGPAAPLPARAVAAIGLRVLEALGAAHLRGILHRDVKPTNIRAAATGPAPCGTGAGGGDPRPARRGGGDRGGGDRGVPWIRPPARPADRAARDARPFDFCALLSPARSTS